jgi:hypothetical protein
MVIFADHFAHAGRPTACEDRFRLYAKTLSVVVLVLIEGMWQFSINGFVLPLNVQWHDAL